MFNPLFSDTTPYAVVRVTTEITLNHTEALDVETFLGWGNLGPELLVNLTISPQNRVKLVNHFTPFWGLTKK
jgi:hypothetical protein